MSAPLESMFDKDQALDWAEEYYRDHGYWPRRLWRVEDTKIGNSGVLTRSAALTTQARYGGTLVQLICERKYYREVCQQTGRECVLDS